MNSLIHQYIICKAYIVLGKNAQEDKGVEGEWDFYVCACAVWVGWETYLR